MSVRPRTTRLTGLLSELGDVLDEVRSSFSVYAWPGVDDEQIDKLFAPSGLEMPTELREWWRWHHGTRIDTTLTDRHAFGPGRWGLMEIPRAVREGTQPDYVPGEGWGQGWVQCR